MKSVRSGNVLGVVELTEDGRLQADSPGVQKDIEQMAAVRRWTPQEAFDKLSAGWSNGYIEIIGVD
ncbi:hypothetical protein GCM10010151_65990 [Actinoallomurus spadix]|uniref:Uncharacterized protein n=1 Tax=Actinoallomurus spadix TaxID=79912 RepID=A0ABN0XKZ4_9ACTN